MDIIIYTTNEVLDHKKGGDGFQDYFWKLPRKPRKINIGDKIYFATKNKIRGYFIIRNIVRTFNGCEIEWNCNSWKNITLIDQCCFQGFKYFRK